MDRKIGCNNFILNKNNQPKVRLRYSKYLRDSFSKNKPTKLDFMKIITDLELENAEMEQTIKLLEFKNKVLEENCHFLREKNYYVERKLHEIELSSDNERFTRQDSCVDETEQTETGKFAYLKERFSGAIFGFVVPNQSKIFRKIKEKRNEIKECDKVICPFKKLNIKVNVYRVVVVLGTLMVLSGVGYAGYKIWKNRFRHPTYLVPSEDEDDDSGEEIFRAPGTSRGAENVGLVKTNSSESFSTDFKSILDTASKK